MCSLFVLNSAHEGAHMNIDYTGDLFIAKHREAGEGPSPSNFPRFSRIRSLDISSLLTTI